ncbi:MAG: UPF0104 family protein [Cyanobacteria bacterium P01_E01_bin.45]
MSLHQLRRSKLVRWLSAVLGLAILILAIDTIRLQLQDYSITDILQAMDAIGARQLLEALLLTIGSYTAIATYDILAFRYIRHPLSPLKVALSGLVTYAISPNIGFAFFTGGALRYRLYSAWNVSAIEIAEVTLFSNLSLWVGVCAVAGAVFVVAPIPVPARIAIPLGSLPLLGVVFVALAATYLVLAATLKRSLQVGDRRIRFPSFKLAVSQIAVFAADWGCAAVALFLLLDLPPTVTFPQFFSVYVVGLGLGLLSTVPGGVGVFETVMLLFLSQFAAEPDILGALIVFRCLYYFLPFVLCVTGLGMYELRRSFRRSQQSDSPDRAH